MNKEEIKKRIVSVVSDMKIDGYEGITKTKLFAYLFDDIGFSHAFNRKKDEYVIEVFVGEEPLAEGKNEIVDFFPTIDNIVAAFDGIKFQIHAHEMFIAGNNIVLRVTMDSSNRNSVDDITFTTNRDDIDNIKNVLQGCLVKKEVLNDENSYRIAYRGQYSIDTTICKFNDWKSNISENYNDDLPYDQMNEVIRSDKAGLIMLYGIPGTGKTSLVKSLINDNRDTNFIFVDTSVCESISDGLFLDFLQEHKNSVIVFEDCEKLLFSRDEMVNESIGTILNLTDGIIAESMKIKFICTFNCDLDKVDAALTRKGRLSVGYEFKKLSLEKTKAIYPEATEEMTLADARNHKTDNGFKSKKRKKIGFA